jgi:hypothetical protein
MRRFIPFEDDWDMLERMCPEALVPYRSGMACAHDLPGAQGERAAKRFVEEAEALGGGVQGGMSALARGSR